MIQGPSPPPGPMLDLEKVAEDFAGDREKLLQLLKTVRKDAFRFCRETAETHEPHLRRWLAREEKKTKETDPRAPEQTWTGALAIGVTTSSEGIAQKIKKEEDKLNEPIRALPKVR